PAPCDTVDGGNGRYPRPSFSQTTTTREARRASLIPLGAVARGPRGLRLVRRRALRGQPRAGEAPGVGDPGRGREGRGRRRWGQGPARRGDRALRALPEVPPGRRGGGHETRQTPRRADQGRPRRGAGGEGRPRTVPPRLPGPPGRAARTRGPLP